MSEKLNILEKINMIMSEVKYIQKQGYNAFHKYAYAREGDFVEAIRPAMVKYGVVMYPSHMKTTVNGEMSLVEVQWTIADAQDLTKGIIVHSSGQGYDKGDKGTAKGITAAKKSALQLAFMLPTGEDAEADLNTDIEAEKKSPVKSQPYMGQQSFTRTAESFPNKGEGVLTVTSGDSKAVDTPPKPKSTSFRRAGAAPVPKAAPLANGHAEEVEY
jgi:hypothetical protein